MVSRLPYIWSILKPLAIPYHVSLFQQDARKCLADILARGKIALLCEGTGLYIEAFLQDHVFTKIPTSESIRSYLSDKKLAELTSILQQNPSIFNHLADTSNKKRLIRAIEISQFLQQNPSFHTVPNPLNSLIFGIHLPRELFRQRIEQRLKNRLAGGLVEEVAGLIAQGVPKERLFFYGLEYKYVTEYLSGDYTKQQLTNKLCIAIQQFAKRQLTYFRRMGKQGMLIHWIDGESSVDDQVMWVLKHLALTCSKYCSPIPL